MTERVTMMSIDVPLNMAHSLHSIAAVNVPLMVRFAGQEVLLALGERAYLDAGRLVSGPASSTPSPLLAAPYPDEQQKPYSGPED